MKNYKLPVLGIAIVLALASCRKEDIRKSNPVDPATYTTKALHWTTADNWSSFNSENGATYFSKLPDSTITNSIVKDGLVLLYKKTGNDIHSLPFQEKDGKTYWYYHVSKGSVRVNAVNANAEGLSRESFSYLLVTPEQLSSLEAKGKTKFDLLQLSYEQVINLLK